MYYNRDLSWLDYNARVLGEAVDENVPLYNRIKFLSIFSSNLDEFFSVRYPIILAIAGVNIKTQRKIDTNISADFPEKIQRKIESLISDSEFILAEKIIPELKSNNIILYHRRRIREEHSSEVTELFLSKVLSFLQPVFLNADTVKKFEPESNKIYMVISLRKHGENLMNHALIKIPSDSLKRFYSLSTIAGIQYVIFIDDIIRENCSYIFPGFEIEGIYSIKFNKSSDLDIDENYSESIVKKIERNLPKRTKGHPSMFFFDSSMPRNIQLYVASFFGIDQNGIFTSGRYHNLGDLSSFPELGMNLTFEEWQPLSLFKISEGSDVFKRIEQNNILLHFPYHSYNVILFFFNQAAIDPDVSEIYITLYRIASDSLIANSLISAAKNGKKVVVFIELKARFDEANNIVWSKKMKNAGVQIIYSIPFIKVHAKTALIVKKTADKQKLYSVISTGNFNELTAAIYADHTLLTNSDDINTEVLALFEFLKKREMPYRNGTLSFNKLLVSQFNLKDSFEQLIKGEIKKVSTTGKGLIKIKLNNLENPEMIDMLYNASKAGVTIQLIVRSICCLIPDIKGLSENITVKSIIDRYLEHTRLFIFGDQADAKTFIGSSDWMTRNIYHRIEVCIPVFDQRCKTELLNYFDIQWNSDNKEVIVPNAIVASINNKVYAPQRSIYDYLKSR